MTHRSSAISSGIIGVAVFAGTVLLSTGGLAQGQSQGPQRPDQGTMSVKNPTGHAKSARLRDFVKPEKPGQDREAPEVRPTAPGGGGSGGGASGGGANNTDPVKQTVFPPASPPVALTSTTGITYTGSYPPDTNIAVGSTQVVEVVNSQYAVFDKTTGAMVLGPSNMFTMFASMTGDDCSWRSGGDPVVLYDRLASRWVVMRYLFTPNIMCIAVSQNSDATGAYNLYSYAFGPDTADYAKLSVWPDAYYMTANTFAANDGPFKGAQVCAFDRAAMIDGLPNASVICFQGTNTWHSLLSADLDSNLPPPAGAPNYFLQYDTNQLSLFKFHVDFAAPVNSTFTGPTAIPVATFTRPCWSCVPQPGVKDKLETLGDRLMYRLSYRNFGAYESLLVSHTVQISTKTANSQTGIRWYEIRTPGSTPTVHQQSTFSPDTTNYRWMSSLAQDNMANIFLGYSAASSTVFPGIRFTVRRSTDALNQMQPESLIKAGAGSQVPPPTSTSGRDRWGDYASVAVDPDGCTLWFATEYLTATGPSNTWATHLFSARFSGCS